MATKPCLAGIQVELLDAFHAFCSFVQAQTHSYCCPPRSLKGQPKSWFPVDGAKLTLVKLQPITNGQSSTAYIKLSTGSQGGGLSNTGYWGIPVQDKQEYQLSVIIQSETAASADQVLPLLSCPCAQLTLQRINPAMLPF